MNHLLFDGRSLKTVSPGAAWNDAYFTSVDDAQDALNGAVVGNMTALGAYDRVPWLFRAVAKRASLVSRMPFAIMRGDTDVTEDPSIASIMKRFRTNLFMAEASKTLFGAAYWFLESNASGRNITPVFLRKQFVQPIVTTGKVTSFSYRGDQTTVARDIPLDRIVYFWNVNFRDATSPGRGEVQVGLGASSVLYAIDAYAAGFFNSGGVKVTVFQAPPQMPQGDKEEFQSFLNRALSGVRNAFRNIVVRSKIEPTVIGSDLKETEAPALTDQERQAVAVAIGIPPPVIDGLHENRATADTVTESMYTDTIIPEFELLAEALNEQLFERFGLKIVPQPEKLEALQSAQLAQAQTVSTIVGKPILTVDEGRAILGYPPMKKEDIPQPPPVVVPVPVPPANREESQDQDQDQESESSQGSGDQESGDQEKEFGDRSARLMRALSTWRKLALAAPGAGVGSPFDDELETCRSKSDVRAVFDKHWPRTTIAQDAPDRVRYDLPAILAELRASRLAAERLLNEDQP